MKITYVKRGTESFPRMIVRGNEIVGMVSQDDWIHRKTYSVTFYGHKIRSYNAGNYFYKLSDAKKYAESVIGNSNV